MGYTTEFKGRIEIVPPLNQDEIAFLQKFAGTRRMDRAKGPYFVDGSGFHGQGQDADIRNFNNPPDGQPGLWCQWTPTDDGQFLQWDGGEKFYESDAWMLYLIEHFLQPGAHADLPVLQKNHVCNGVIYAQGEERSDQWTLRVANNVVVVSDGLDGAPEDVLAHFAEGFDDEDDYEPMLPPPPRQLPPA